MNKSNKFRFLTLILFLSITFSLPTMATTLDKATIFQANCAGCHVNGGNIVRRGKNLTMRALKRNNMDSIESISAIVANGKNNMSAYKDRLTEQQIQNVAEYVLEKAETGWQKK